MFVSLQFKIELKKNRLVPLSAGGTVLMRDF